MLLKYIAIGLLIYFPIKIESSTIWFSSSSTVGDWLGVHAGLLTICNETVDGELPDDFDEWCSLLDFFIDEEDEDDLEGLPFGGVTVPPPIYFGDLIVDDDDEEVNFGEMLDALGDGFACLGEDVADRLPLEEILEVEEEGGIEGCKDIKLGIFLFKTANSSDLWILGIWKVLFNFPPSKSFFTSSSRLSLSILSFSRFFLYCEEELDDEFLLLELLLPLLLLLLWCEFDLEDEECLDDEDLFDDDEDGLDSFGLTDEDLDFEEDELLKVIFKSDDEGAIDGLIITLLSLW